MSQFSSRQKKWGKVINWTGVKDILKMFTNQAKASINTVSMARDNKKFFLQTHSKLTIELETVKTRDVVVGCGSWEKREKILKCNLDFPRVNLFTKQKGQRLRKEFSYKSHLKLHFHNSILGKYPSARKIIILLLKKILERSFSHFLHLNELSREDIVKVLSIMRETEKIEGRKKRKNFSYTLKIKNFLSSCLFRL